MRRILPLCLAVGCNQAGPWPDNARAPDGAAPWSHPTDVACRDFEDDGSDLVVVDGFQYCGASSAFEQIVPVDDPVYTECTSDATVAAERVMAVYDGERARAYRLDSLQGREIVHTDWDGEEVLVTYCPIIAGGEVFHRDLGGVPDTRFNVAGLWGSANTVTPREELATGDYTVYTTWDGHALVGPGRPGSLTPFAALIDYTTIGEFVARHASLGERCEMWLGQEVLGIDCPQACAYRVAVCGEGEYEAAECERACEERPRANTDCMLLSDTCDEQRRC